MGRIACILDNNTVKYSQSFQIEVNTNDGFVLLANGAGMLPFLSTFKLKTLVNIVNLNKPGGPGNHTKRGNLPLVDNFKHISSHQKDIKPFQTKSMTFLVFSKCWFTTTEYVKYLCSFVKGQTNILRMSCR